MASAYTQQYNNVFKTWVLIFLFVGLVSAVFFIIGIYTEQLGFAIFGLVISLAQAFIAYFTGDKIALAVARAKEVQPEESPRIHTMIDNLVKITGIPKPRVFISPDKSANAFACGRNPKNASICLNQGILDLLDKNELEGVIAHELSHIKNRDILIMTVTMVLSSVVSFVADIGFRLLFFGQGRDRDNESKSPILLILYILTIVLAPIVAMMIQLAISRKREFLADATAVTITRYPEGLIGALEKLYNSPVPASNYATSMNHFYIAPPKKEFGKKVAGLFSTHPSIEDRVQALRGM